MVFKSIIGATCACLAVVSFNTNAALIGVLPATPGGSDYQAYYDDVADLTWLADANANGAMNWADANAWAADLDVAGVTGWRLPDTLQPDPSCNSSAGGYSYGYNCTGSEMGNLFYNVLGNTAGSLSNTDPFSNIQSLFYWSATENATVDTGAWIMFMASGYQDTQSKSGNWYAWAVQSGDVSAVPVPAAVWLFGSGLLGLIGIARRKAHA